jgi:hypothetical protein
MAKESKFLPHKSFINSVYTKKNLNITKTAEIVAKHMKLTYNDNFRRTLSSFISSNLDDRTESTTLIEHGEHFKMAMTNKLKKSKYYLITCAQNATPVNEDFLKNMEAYATFLEAEIVVIPLRYKNPTSVFTDKKVDKWDESVTKYLHARREHIHPKLVLLGDVKVQPTSSNPLQAKELMSSLNSCIVGHPRVHLRSVPRLKTYDPKVMITTGTCTYANYTDSNSGKVGEAHHTYGFVVVEIKDENIFYMRNVTSTEEGEFTDLYFTIRNGKVYKNKKISTIVLGDLHLGKHDISIINTIEEKLIKVLKPDYTIIHDIVDMYSVRKHDIKNPVKEYLAHKYQTNLIEKELQEVFNFCDKWKKYGLVVVRSNHDEHLDQYIVGQDWRKDPVNALTYNKFLQVLLEEKAPKGLLPYILEERYGKDITTLGIDDSFRVLGWELGFHGHLGTNGARGSNTTFRKLSTKIIKNHDHTVFREDGCLSSGTCTKYEMGYNKGLTTWLHGATIVHTDGKAQQIILIENNFTTLWTKTT